jgi:hypothetical protein
MRDNLRMFPAIVLRLCRGRPFGRLVVRAKRAVVTCILAGTALLTAGCGGPQNPVRVSSIHTGGFVSGLWDGLTIAIGFIAHIINRSKYDFIALHFRAPYFFGWLIGVLLFLAVFGGFGYRSRKVAVRRTRAI